MNKENFTIGEKCKAAITIHKKLEEFKKTRAIATAVEICDMMLKEWEEWQAQRQADKKPAKQSKKRMATIFMRTSDEKAGAVAFRKVLERIKNWQAAPDAKAEKLAREGRKMKLRNKKTGEIEHYGICLDKMGSSGFGRVEYCYDTIEELNKEWEDYKPKEITKYYMNPYIKDENTCNAIENWLKSLKYKADFVTVNIGDYDHGGICIKDGIFVIYEPFSRCLISFVGIPLDKKFVKTVKEHDVARYADFFKVKIKSLIGKELNENKS